MPRSNVPMHLSAMRRATKPPGQWPDTEAVTYYRKLKEENPADFYDKLETAEAQYAALKQKIKANDIRKESVKRPAQVKAQKSTANEEADLGTQDAIALAERLLGEMAESKAWED